MVQNTDINSDDDSAMYMLLEPDSVKKKFNLPDEDLEILQDFGKSFGEQVDVFIADFYEWMQVQPEFKVFFTSASLLETVKSKQTLYWREFIAGKITTLYLNNRQKVGEVHAKIGLPLYSYCVSMNFSCEWWKNRAEELLSDKGVDYKSIVRLRGIIDKLIQLDITIVTETYHRKTQQTIKENLAKTEKIVKDVTSVAASVVEGDYSIKILEDSKLSKAVNQMISVLDAKEKESKRDSWIKTGQAQLANNLRGDLALEDVASKTIEYLSKYLEAHVGTFYLLEGDKLKLAGSYAFKHRRGDSHEFTVGEGLIGQSVLEKQVMQIEELPSGYIRVNSSIGEADCHSVLIAPILFEDKVVAVIELGAFKKFADIHLEFVEVINSSIAVAVESAKNRKIMSGLLSESQRKSEELQTQQLELETINKDLEKQAQEIKASEEELKSQSEELQAINEELEEKTQALENQKRDIEEKNKNLEKSKELIQAKAKELQQSSKYKSEFLSNMSHELRTPLNSLLILAQSLTENDDNSLSKEQVEKAKVIHSSGQDLLNLINDILDLSKVEAGKLQIEFGSLSVKQMTETVFNRLKPLADSKNIKFEEIYDSDVPDIIISDEMRIEQILKNLLSNAIKFTSKEGKVTLKIRVSDQNDKLINSKLKNEELVAFEVIDTGIGISADQQHGVFEAFQQADGSTNRSYGGTGLGLTISRQLAELLGGEIHLESELGKGSTFTLFIPTKNKESSVDVGEHVSSNLALDSLTDQVSTEKTNEPLVLIIEDDENFKDIMITCLSERMISCITADTGGEGFELAKSRQPTGIILDVGLPDINGLELLDKIRLNEKTKHIPVHIVTSYDLKEKSLAKGAVGFVSKPVSQESLTELLDKASNAIEEPVKEILVVEDDPIQCDSLCKSLNTQEVNVTTVSTCKEAEKILKSQRIHCMILDLCLPDESGLDFLKRMNSEEHVLLPAIVIHTAKDLTQEEERELNEYTPTIVIKSADAPNRLSDEVNLFLHRITPHVRKTTSRLNLKDETIEGKKVLLVDDDMRNNIALGSYLRDHGLQTVTADNGEMAIECLEREDDVDIILMDIMMPVKDGYDTMKYIREQKQFKNLPIIALTAKAMSEDRTKCLQAGANDYITKPVDLDKLFNVMKVWLYK